MDPGARTPEELERLFEDAFVVRDRGALRALFEARALLVAEGGAGRVRGSEEIANSASALWERDYTYLADPRQVLQAHDVALVLAERCINVVRRGPGGRWRYAISVLEFDKRDAKEQR
jgi:Domain of unknown function (DUF4440)